jgi:20S proteasome alpha/beta subunit
VLEERLAAAEAQRSTLWSRLQSAANESDHEATAEAYRRNTSELLQMYREHKIKVGLLFKGVVR